MKMKYLMLHGFALVFVALLCVYDIHALPGGAPNGACVTMTPRHVNRGTGGGFIAAQPANTSVYGLTMSASNYTVGRSIQVRVSDTRPASNGARGYRGVLLQARTAGGSSTPVGRWSSAPANTKLVTCSVNNDAVTHSNTNVKNESNVFVWTPTANHGRVNFIFTVAQSREVFWTRQTSNTLEFAGSSSSRNVAHRLLIVFIAVVLRFM